MNEYLDHFSCAYCILDTALPYNETTTTKNWNPIFSRKFGILIEHNNEAIFHAQTVSNCELVHFYSIYIKPVALGTNAQQSSTILENLLSFGFPWHIRRNITNYLLAKLGISDSLTYATREITEIAQCNFTKQSSTSTLYCLSAYISDPNTYTIINILRKNSKHMWSQNELAKVETSYRQHTQEK